MKTIARVSAGLLWSLGLVMVATCTPQEVKQPPDEATVQLFWYHETEFAGFYAADQQGYYAEEGLAVTLLPRPGPGTGVNAPLMDKTADFRPVDPGEPDLVLRFLRATLRGWQWAIENPAEAGPLALKYDPTLDAAHRVAMMEASVPLVHTGEDQIGWMRAEV